MEHVEFVQELLLLAEEVLEEEEDELLFVCLTVGMAKGRKVAAEEKQTVAQVSTSELAQTMSQKVDALQREVEELRKELEAAKVAKAT